MKKIDKTKEIVNKMRNNLYNTKAAAEIRDIDSVGRKVAVYLAKFDNIDSDNDMIQKGAFTKSIQERGPQSAGNRKIAFLRHHNWEMQIGKFLELNEDDNGLFAIGELGTSTQGEDAFRDYEDGIIREHSIGFQYICLLYTSPSPRDRQKSRMPSSA